MGKREENKREKLRRNSEVESLSWFFLFFLPISRWLSLYL